MRTPRALIGMTLAAALVLGACGGGDDDTPTGSDQAPSSASTTASATPSPTVTADDRPLTGTTLEKASAAALKATDGGRITETSGSDDADHAYEVDVLMPSGEDVTVELDTSFKVTKLDR